MTSQTPHAGGLSTFGGITFKLIMLASDKYHFFNNEMDYSERIIWEPEA